MHIIAWNIHESYTFTWSSRQLYTTVSCFMQTGPAGKAETGLPGRTSQMPGPAQSWLQR